VIVLGRVKLKGMIIDMAEVTAPIAEEIGFKVAGIISDSIPKSNKYLWYLKEDDGVSKEVILELHKGNFEPSPIRIDWENAKPLTIAREEMVG
ncbi:MAG: hypothetical protein QXO04_05275, partial [Nitrososphaerota archaeon]